MEDDVLVIRVENDSYSQTDLQRANELLARAGMRFTEEGRDGHPEQRLVLKVDKEVLDRVTRRDAGRRKTGLAISVQEMRSYADTHTAAECAEYAGVSKRTYFRRVRAAKADGTWDDGAAGYRLF